MRKGTSAVVSETLRGRAENGLTGLKKFTSRVFGLV